jgi:hypothetical protein
VVVAVAALMAYIVITVADGWADWVVLGVIVAGVYGGAVAAHHRIYPSCRRTFIRHWDE